jgi:ABC-type dipeptide/oligopeptide/nickel transport system permease subunit
MSGPQPSNPSRDACHSPIIIDMSLDMGYAVLDIAALSVIGLGVQPPSQSGAP